MADRREEVRLLGASPEAPDALAALAASPRSRGRADKRRAITAAARRVFAREGYARTSIDAIATAAEVSTRTVYNHFPDGKRQLFSAVVLASATQVADGFAADVERRTAGTGPEEHLVALGHACAALRSDFPEHFALVEQIEAEAPRFPASVTDAWRQAGPLRVQRELASRLAQLAEHGLLSLDDPMRAALHFSALATAGLITHYGAPPLTPDQRDDAVLAGVDAYLNGYASASRRRAGRLTQPAERRS